MSSLLLRNSLRKSYIWRLSVSAAPAVWMALAATPKAEMGSAIVMMAIYGQAMKEGSRVLLRLWARRRFSARLVAASDYQGAHMQDCLITYALEAFSGSAVARSAVWFANHAMIGWTTHSPHVRRGILPVTT